MEKLEQRSKNTASCHSDVSFGRRNQPPDIRKNEINQKHIALVGQPNMGKTTLFNLLTGLNQHVGNWPGKTVERKEGFFNYQNNPYRIVDLPGTYSLTANSPEEVITREYILHEKPDIVLAIVSAANLERSLYLIAELVGMGIPLVIGLNMMDVAKQEGMLVEPQVLEAALGIPVIPLVATRSEGVMVLLDTVEKVIRGEILPEPRMPEIREDHQDALDQVIRAIDGYVPEPYPTHWSAVKLLEGDSEISSLLQENLPSERWQQVYDVLLDHDDAMLAIASGRYEWIGRLVRAAVVKPKAGQISRTAKLDRWAAHPFWGLIILAAILGLVFWLTFTIGGPIQEWISSSLVIPLGTAAESGLASAPFWLRSLIVDGLIGGVGSVLTFLPILVIFFGSFGLLEDLGYMARAAYVMDNFMHMMGLHGKSFLPLFLGFGCNVPAVMGTRVIESWPARLLTILISPLVPCTARMAVVAFLAPAFFGKQAALVSWGLIMLSLLILILSGVLLNRTIFRGERSAFIMEMPLYHEPNWRTVGLLIWQRSYSFLKKAGTLILGISIVIWALSMLPGGNLETSYLARIGYFLEPIGRWMGLDWRLTVALLTSFAAKENSIATLGVLFGASDMGLAQTVASTYSLATGLSFLTVSILFIPCAATVAVIKQETNSWKWTLFNIGLMLVVSIGAASGIYWLMTSLGF
ncbi:MAG: ferrous iron transport protein B [Anaerolineaceae bacterium]|nr:ferrous iron transport protein B [Anaerolineaceae bacterium]